MEPQELEDWPLDPPRATHFHARATLKVAPSYVARHHRWKADNKLTDDDPGVVEHEATSDVFGFLYSYDQLDCSNLAGAERVVRRL